MADDPVILSPAQYEAHLIKLYVKQPGVDALDLNRVWLQIEDVEVIIQSLINTQVTALNLRNCRLEGGMERLAESLIKTKIETINVSHCELSYTDMVHLIKILKNSQITSLDISHNCCQLDTSLMEELTSCLLSSKITHLNISRILPYKDRPPMFGMLFSSLPGTAVKDLHVAENGLCLAELQVLGESLKDSKVEVLDLSRNNFGNYGLDALIPGLVSSRVSKLNLSENKITVFYNLGKCLKDTQIKSLNLQNSQDEYRSGFFAAQFLRAKCLEELNFQCYGNKEVALELMRNLKFSNLKKLGISNDSNLEVVSEFASAVKFTGMTDISFCDCCHQVQALYILGECLAETTLTKINLSRCFDFNLGEALGVAMAAFIEKTKGSLVKSLILSHCKLGIIGAKTVAPKLAQTTFTHFDLSYCCIGSGVLDIAANLKFTSITCLNLKENWIKDTGAITLVKHLKGTQVTELDIGYSGITSEGAKALAAHLKDTKLICLYLCHNNIDSDGLEALAAGAENTLITELDVSGNPGTEYNGFITSPCIRNVLWKNRASVQPFIHTFKLLASSGNTILQFDHSADNPDIEGFIDEALVLYKTIVNKPDYVNILAKEKSIFLTNREILTLMLDEFPKQFSSFVSRSIESDLSQRISLLKRVENSGLSVLVESLLLHRPTYIIDEEQGILHPYVYTLLDKYKQPLYNLSIEPGFKTKLIDYFTEHADLEYASDVVNLLRNK